MLGTLFHIPHSGFSLKAMGAPAHRSIFFQRTPNPIFMGRPAPLHPTGALTTSFSSSDSSVSDLSSRPLDNRFTSANVGLDAAGGGRSRRVRLLEQCDQIVSVTTLSRFTVTDQIFIELSSVHRQACFPSVDRDFVLVGRVPNSRGIWSSRRFIDLTLSHKSPDRNHKRLASRGFQLFPSRVQDNVSRSKKSCPTSHNPPMLVGLGRSATLRKCSATSVEPRPFLYAIACVDVLWPFLADDLKHARTRSYE